MKKKLLVIGAFPPPDVKIYGGVVTTCRTLLNSSFFDHYKLLLIDSTQISNPPPSLFFRTLLAFRRLIRFLTSLFMEKPDAVLLFTSIGASVLEKGAMAWIARLTRVPVLLFPRGAGLIQTVQESRLQSLWMSTAMRGATHFLCQGPVWQRFAIGILGFSEERAPVIENWTATEELLMIGHSRKFDQVIRMPRLLFIGWLIKEKGIFELLEACQTLSRKYNFRLIIAGKGHAEEDCRAFVRSHGLENIIEFTGWVDGEAKEILLTDSDILVLPSWEEGFPNAIIEAMAAKLAVVVTAVGNIPDLIFSYQQAILVSPKSADDLKDAIERILLDQQLLEGIAERGHVFARKNFSVEQGVAKLTAVIDKAIAENVTSRKSGKICAE
jgi:glycosyltransferase involved in cell wall biosynthesis